MRITKNAPSEPLLASEIFALRDLHSFLRQPPGEKKKYFAMFFVRWWAISYTDADLSATSEGLRWCTGVEFMRK